MGIWKVIIPTAATNLVLNPSAEIATPANYAAHNSATISRETTVARFGDYCYKILTNAVTNRGLSLTTQALGNADHYITFYIYGWTGGTFQVSCDAGANYNNASIIGGATGGWVRYGVSIVAAQCNASVATIIRISSPSDNFVYLDAAQVEQSAYYTTYIDGNRANSPIYGENTGSLYGWNGHRHASTSFRDAQERGGGRERDLFDDYGIDIIQQTGTGMPPVMNNLQALALQPGAAFQSTKTLPRQVALISAIQSTSLANYHSKRQDLIDLIKPDGVRGAQPFVLGYAGANSGKTVYCRFRYADGLGTGAIVGGPDFLEFQIPLALLAVDPYWIEDNRETATLGFVSTLTSVNAVMARVNGLWQKLGTGFNGDCSCSAYDPTTGRIYFGGSFTTANGVTVNRICYWNPTTATFTAMDAGVGASSVLAIAIAPNGDVWIGGTFATVGSGAAAAVGLAKWSLAGSSWSVPTATATSFSSVKALVIDGSGNLYGGGDFLNYSGNANCDRIFKYTAAGAFAATGTGMSDSVSALAVGIDGTSIYVGGVFVSGNSVTLNGMGYWNGTTFVAMGGGLGSAVNCLAIARNGNVYAGGNFTASGSPAVSLAGVGMWNGTGWAPLSSGVTGGAGGVYFMYFGGDGLLYVSGGYTTVGPFTTGMPAVWNGSNWQLLDIESASPPSFFYTFLVLPNGDLYLGMSSGAYTFIVGSPTTAIVSTNTVSVFPNFTILGPSSATMTLQAIQNLSSDQTLRFNLVVNLGERLLLSLQPGAKRMVSDWRGVLPGQPLPTSDFANFRLQPTRADGAATNTIITFVTGTTTGALFLMHWIVGHWSLDGAAA